MEVIEGMNKLQMSIGRGEGQRKGLNILTCHTGGTTISPWSDTILPPGTLLTDSTTAT